MLSILFRPSRSRLAALSPNSHLRHIHFSPFLNSVPKSCPVCTRSLPSPVPACTKCWNIFALPTDVTHHELLGLPYDPNPFLVDTHALKRKFREAQAICHPDSWASKDPDKQDVAQALSARVNQAYQSLLHPLSRAEYILELNHAPVSETDQVQDMEFMAEIMESREIIDDAEDRSQVEALQEENQEKMSETVKVLENLFQNKDWSNARAAAIRLRYLQGIQRAAKRWLENH